MKIEENRAVSGTIRDYHHWMRLTVTTEFAIEWLLWNYFHNSLTTPLDLSQAWQEITLF